MGLTGTFLVRTAAGFVPSREERRNRGAARIDRSAERSAGSAERSTSSPARSTSSAERSTSSRHDRLARRNDRQAPGTITSSAERSTSSPARSTSSGWFFSSTGADIPHPPGLPWSSLRPWERRSRSSGRATRARSPTSSPSRASRSHRADGAGAERSWGATRTSSRGSSRSRTRPIEKLGPVDDPMVGVCVHWFYGPHTCDGVVGRRTRSSFASNFSGRWPGLVGLLNTGACLEMLERPFSRAWDRRPRLDQGRRLHGAPRRVVLERRHRVSHERNRVPRADRARRREARAHRGGRDPQAGACSSSCSATRRWA